MTIVQSGRVPNFLPSRNGLHFDNSFPPGIPDLVIRLPLPGNPTINIGDASTGICGGMTWTVLDYFQAAPRLHPPTQTTLPQAGDPLMTYLEAQLVNSWPLGDPFNGNAVREFTFITSSNHDTWLSRGNAWRMIREEWPKVRADIDAGRLSNLRIVPATLADDAPVFPTNIPQITDA